MLMDDTVLLATSHEQAEEKVCVLNEFCTSSGMMINQAKTQFMAINGAAEDKEPLEVDGVTIENCSSYTYLGCIFTQDANLKNAIKEQCSRKMCHVTKFEAFIEKNRNAPFKVKEKVWSAALVSSILYGIESWLGLAAIETANAMYMRSVRTLLGVRKTTAGELCLIEAGLPMLVNKAKSIQKKTFEKFIDERSELTDDPLMFTLEKCRTANTPCARYIRSLEQHDHDQEVQILKEKARTSTRTKYRTYYNLMNPELKRHEMYADLNVKEYARLTTTRFRLSSHNLAIERGRWLRKPPEERVCPECRVMQNEQHALKDCVINDAKRQSFADLCLNLPDFFNVPSQRMTHWCHELIQLFM
jgi:hypothetical protein